MRTIKAALDALNNRPNNPFILKGGTALALCYGLDRFSEDIDLDAVRATAGRQQFLFTFQDLAVQNHWPMRVAKDTPYVQRVFLHYDPDNPENAVKVELSRRVREIDPQVLTTRNGIRTYTIDRLCNLKISAYASRDRIRDLYDICFIWDNYRQNLKPQTIDMLRDTISYRGLDEVDYLVSTQEDKLIDARSRQTLGDRFLEMYDQLGLFRAVMPDTPVQESTKSKRSHHHGLSR